MTTGSYLEYALTLLAWVISNGIWGTLTATGFFALPLLFRLISLWLKAREQGKGEGSASELMLAWMENSVYAALLVMMFTCVPLIDIDISQIKYDVKRSEKCNVYTPAKPEQSGYAPLINDISGQTAAVPVWWYLVHTLSKGITSAATAALPCQPDLRQLRFDIQHTRINDPVLGQELLDFVMECHSSSLARLKQQGIALKTSEAQDIMWPGSQRFLTQPGYYDTDRARSPREPWPYNATRDAGLINTGNGGYPTCKQWWSDGDTGLRTRILAQVKPDKLDRLRKLGFLKEQYEEAVLRTVVSPRNMQVSQSGQVYPGYGGNIDRSLTNDVTRLAATVGHSLSSLAMFPAFDSVRQALPMVQALLLMALVICTPLVTVLSAYNMKVVLTLTFAQFGTMFLTFWWELARWLDGWLIEMLYNSDTHSSWNLLGLQNTQDDLILQFVLGAMFIVLPAFWVGALGWSGVKIGGAVDGVIKSGTRQTEKAGGELGSKLIR